MSHKNGQEESGPDKAAALTKIPAEAPAKQGTVQAYYTVPEPEESLRPPSLK